MAEEKRELEIFGLEIYKQRSELQRKYTFVLLAVAASAVALSFRRTTDSRIVWSMIPLALAVICWASSFFAGCKHLEYISDGLYANIDVLVYKAKGMVDEAETANRKVKCYNEKAASFWDWQFRLLLCGAVLFAIWHVIGMINTTIDPCDYRGR